MLNTATVTEATVKVCLGSYDETMLHTLPGGDNGPSSYDPSGSDSDIVVTWIGESGLVHTGKARVLRLFKSFPNQRPYLEASPCPGAWSMVSLDKILNVSRASQF
jgi:hypothetical protein